MAAYFKIPRDKGFIRFLFYLPPAFTKFGLLLLLLLPRKSWNNHVLASSRNTQIAKKIKDSSY